jgi:hypothetical protein
MRTRVRGGEGNRVVRTAPSAKPALHGKKGNPTGFDEVVLFARAVYSGNAACYYLVCVRPWLSMPCMVLVTHVSVCVCVLGRGGAKGRWRTAKEILTRFELFFKRGN